MGFGDFSLTRDADERRLLHRANDDSLVAVTVTIQKNLQQHRGLRANQASLKQAIACCLALGPERTPDKVVVPDSKGDYLMLVRTLPSKAAANGFEYYCGTNRLAVEGHAFKFDLRRIERGGHGGDHAAAELERADMEEVEIDDGGEDAPAQPRALLTKEQAKAARAKAAKPVERRKRVELSDDEEDDGGPSAAFQQMQQVRTKTADEEDSDSGDNLFQPAKAKGKGMGKVVRRKTSDAHHRGAGATGGRSVKKTGGRWSEAEIKKLKKAVEECGDKSLLLRSLSNPCCSSSSNPVGTASSGR